jgi:hypothetical protein
MLNHKYKLMQQVIVGLILSFTFFFTATHVYAGDKDKKKSNPVKAVVNDTKKKADAAKKAAQQKAESVAAEAKKKADAAAAQAKVQAAAAAASVALVASYTKEASAGMKLEPVKPASVSGKCSAKNNGTSVGYCNYADVDIRARGSMFGQEQLFGPGLLKTQVSGAAGIVAYADEATGAIGATASAKQIVTLGFFGGKPFDVGLNCSFTKGGKSDYTLSYGASMSTPAIPSLSASDILEAIVTKGIKAKQGTKPTTSAKVMKELASIDVPCTVVMPDMKLFSGVPAINIYTVASTMTIAAQNWKITNDNVSVDIVVSTGVTAQLGGTEIEISAKGMDKPFKTKVPGLGYKQDFANLVKMPVKIDL